MVESTLPRTVYPIHYGPIATPNRHLTATIGHSIGTHRTSLAINQAVEKGVDFTKKWAFVETREIAMLSLPHLGNTAAKRAVAIGKHGTDVYYELF